LEETFSLALGLGFLLGLKHAIEADHVIAVTTIVSQQGSVLRSGLVGMLWGIGHTISLFIAGIFVIFLQVAIPEGVATILEFSVALMIIFLGGRILYYLLRNRKKVHSHQHSHENTINNKVDNGKSFFANLSFQPLIVGMVHGLAGSAALTLLVLTEVMRGDKQLLGLIYLLVFGIGSIGGMLLISVFISLPFVFTSTKLENIHIPIKFFASVASIIFGFYYAWEVLTGA